MSARAEAFADQAAEHFANPATAGRLFVPNAIENGNIGFEHDSLEEAWPDVDPGFAPLGSLVMVQIRQPKLTTAGGGIELTDDLRKTELDNTQVAKVIALGALAFRNRETRQPWPEGAWCSVGDFVRVPKFQGDYFQITYTRRVRKVDDYSGKTTESLAKDRVLFAQFKDLALLGKYPSAEAALAAKAFL